MKKQEIFKTLSEYKRILEEKGYNVIYIGLYGSQNYNVDDELSDIDAKAIILPTLHDIIFRKVTSTTIELEKGAIDVKDLITFYDVIRKGNFSYVEAIDTEYSIGDKYIKELFTQIRPNLKSILGAIHEKRKALTHEYPSKTEEFKKWGFDPKQYHHIIRLQHLLDFNVKLRMPHRYRSYMRYYDDGEKHYYGATVFDVFRKNMIDIKRNVNNMDLRRVVENADICVEYAKELIPEDYKYEPVDLSDEINKYIEDKLKIELLKNNNVVSAREYRTFDNDIPKKDLEKFPILEQYKGQDISYIVYESIELL